MKWCKHQTDSWSVCPVVGVGKGVVIKVHLTPIYVGSNAYLHGVMGC